MASSASGEFVNVTAATINSVCGFVTLDVSAQGSGLYHVYYLPYVQSGDGAWLHFHWLNCTNQTDHACVLGAPHDDGADPCATVSPSGAAGLVLGLETRNAFHGFQDTELIAAPSEVAALTAAYPVLMRPPMHATAIATAAPFMVFVDDAAHPVRNFDTMSARWALWPGPAPNVFVGQNIAPGTFFVFQIGLFASSGPLVNLTVQFTELLGPAGKSIPSTALRVFNLGGMGIDNATFTQVYNLSAGGIGSLYVGVDIASDAGLVGNFTGSCTVSCASCSGQSVPVFITLGLAGPVSPDHGEQDIYSLSRMSWLDSTIGWEDTIPPPFVPVSVLPSAEMLTVMCLNKAVGVSPNGMPSFMNVNTSKVRMGQAQTITRSLLGSTGVAFTAFDATSVPVPLKVTQAAAVTSITNTSVSWASTSVGSVGSPSAQLTMSMIGSLDFDSYGEYSVTLSATGTAPVVLSDVQVGYEVNPALLQYYVGMGAEGSAFPATNGDSPVLTWRWSNATCTNKLWAGRIDAGILLNLKGEGDLWNSPMFGVDYPVIPFVPPSWGGASALPTRNSNGVNLSSTGVVTAFSGPRTLSPGTSITFLFDLLMTPSRPLDMAAHWRMRTVQVGYGTDYLSPQTVAAQGATIVTLHQGIPGVINGSLVNPYINYPFTPDVVPFLANYTAQANALGMRTKFYYTIRELSNHAAELFPLMALQGEVLLDEGGPYVIPQPGYCQDWDCHGGEAYLHQHVQDRYTACWQQGLGDGEWDAAVCDRGTSRWLSYYIRGLQYSVIQAPNINGVYYDGINFDRKSMRRVRRAADAAVQSRSVAVSAQLQSLQAGERGTHLDLHTGRDDTPPVTSYASHYAYMDAVWNGEGFDFTKGPEYWMVEVSSQLHGLTGDRLGGTVPEDDFKGMLWGMTQRNSASAPALWALWDDARLNETVAVGWWEDEADLLVTPGYNCSAAAPPYHTRVLATTFSAYGSHALVAVASFCPSDESVTLDIDWAGLGLDESHVTVTAPDVPGVQKGGPVPNAAGPFDVKGGAGVLLLLQKATVLPL